SLYSVFRAYELSGPLRVEALQAAFAEVLRRHEVLRSAFPVVDGQAVQTVGPVPELPVRVVALGEEAARELAEREADLAFDLERGPLLRPVLVRLAEDRHWLLLSLHHIACDARSVELLLGELAAFYAESRLPEPELQYADFASWEARQGDALEALHLPFWRERLSGLTELRLPFDRPRPVAQSFRGERRFLELEIDLGAVGERARELRTTRFTFLLAAFAAFLRRITGQEDLAVGSPFAGRTCPGTEDLIGFFVQTLVLRFDASGDPSFADLVRRVFLSVAEAQAHQDLPFDNLVRALRPERSLSHNPLFQVMFAVQAASANRLELPGLQVERIPIATRTAKFDLTVEVVEPSSLVVEYDSELFDWPTLQRLADAFNRLLAGCLEDPQRPLSRLPLLSSAELHQMLAEWSPPQAAGEEDGAAGLHELFFRQAERTPGAEALIAGGERITYRELAGRAQRLARRLRKLGVGPEGRVGIFAERSADMIVALLGTLAAGGAYVPLDPDYPAERIAFILEDAAVPLVLAQSSLIARVPAGSARVICLEEEAQDQEAEVESTLLPGNLAYLIYTSGSTGRPKGVAISHGSALARMRWARQAFAPEELAGMLASTSICFDVSVFELFAPLSWGGKLILCRNVLDLPRLPERGEVVSLCTVPSALAELVEMGGLPPRLRTLNLAGEALRGSLVERLWELPGVERVLDLYGPSEDTTYSTLGASTRGEPGEPAIGRPLPGSRAYVLDSRLAVLPRGAAGHLYLAGVGLARGYLGRPDLTAERFLPDPLSTLPGQRLYFSGDLARHRANGELEYLGRIDHQVKVRGFRIEPGEIEAVISGMEGVREVVVTCEGSSGDVALAAWFVPDPACEPSAGTLRAALRERLPEYMVPSQFIRLDALPRTPNGKLDRAALPALSGVSRESAGRPPSTPLEILIADVWSAVLGRAGIGADDDFFDLG
ncbi:MAG TPA: amino acid adenylation domain-containing protein, partial [Thermoanaerobaculia bacterium]|nr:amino acid adenylation domain-containing protein [Thermoanaerobaculia bacterium]